MLNAKNLNIWGTTAQIFLNKTENKFYGTWLQTDSPPLRSLSALIQMLL